MVGIRARELRREEDGDALCHTSSPSSFPRRLITVYVKGEEEEEGVEERERERVAFRTFQSRVRRHHFRQRYWQVSKISLNIDPFQNTFARELHIHM